MFAWIKRRFGIIKRNLTWYELIVVGFIGPLLTPLFAAVLRSLFTTLEPDVSNRLETAMIICLLIFTPIVLARIAYLLFFEAERHQLPDSFDHPNLRFDTFLLSSPESIEAVNALVRTTFPDSTIPDGIVHDILVKNPQATLGLYQRRGAGGKFAGKQELVGCASCWPVGESVYERLRANALNEDEITAHDILDPTAAARTRYFYVPVMLVRDWRQEAGRLQAAALLAAFLEHIRRTYLASAPGLPRTIFFVGFTQQGIDLAKRLGLQRQSLVTQYGKTEREFFQLDLSADTIADLDRHERKILMRAIGLRTKVSPV